MQLYFDPSQVHFYSEASCIVFVYFITDRPQARQPTVPAKWKCSPAGSDLLKMEHEMLSNKVLTIPLVVNSMQQRGAGLSSSGSQP